MSSERILEDVVSADGQVAEATQDIVKGAAEMDDHVERLAFKLADAVNDGSLALADLREHVIWANALDREAVQLSGGDIANLAGPDYIEGTGRRLVNRSGRRALNSVKTDRHRQGYRAKHRTRLGMLDERFVAR